MTTKATCPDCGAFCERWGNAWRCPWSKVRGAVVADREAGAIVNCGRPYAGDRTDIAAPIQGRTTL